MDTVTTKTRCESIDQIVEWTRPDGTLNIEAGDLILEYGKLQQIARIDLVEDGRFVRYELERSSTGRLARGRLRLLHDAFDLVGVDAGLEPDDHLTDRCSFVGEIGGDHPAGDQEPTGRMRLGFAGVPGQESGQRVLHDPDGRPVEVAPASRLKNPGLDEEEA
jgi:hypothetical protein